MSNVTCLTFNAFQENTYIISDDHKSAIIVDPGCHSDAEQNELKNYVEVNKLQVERVVNTHCHIDHIFGNGYCCSTFGVGLYIHRGEQPVLDSYLQVAAMYGLEVEPSPMPSGFLEEGKTLNVGMAELEIFLTPGHSPASLSFYNRKDGYILGGDVLFAGSIGRTDLPGGNLQTLMQSIQDSFLTLPDHTIVYSGHGPATTIGAEREHNPFLNA